LRMAKHLYSNCSVRITLGPLTAPLFVAKVNVCVRAMKLYRGSRYIAPLILNFGTG
jgi:hypothetical protein